MAKAQSSTLEQHNHEAGITRHRSRQSLSLFHAPPHKNAPSSTHTHAYSRKTDITHDLEHYFTHAHSHNRWGKCTEGSRRIRADMKIMTGGQPSCTSLCTPRATSPASVQGVSCSCGGSFCPPSPPSTQYPSCCITAHDSSTVRVSFFCACRACVIHSSSATCSHGTTSRQ